MSEIIKYSDMVLCGHSVAELCLKEFNAPVPAPELKPELTMDDVLALRADAQELYDNAQAKASALLQEAQEKIKELYGQAQQDIERKEKEGFQKGYDEGFAKAKAEVDKKYEKIFEAEFSQLRDVILSFQKSYQLALKKAESSLVKLSFDIAKKVIHDEAQKNEAIILAMVKEGLDRVIERTNIVVRINPAQLYIVESHKKKIIAALERVDSFELREDPKVDLGGCIVETGSGSVEVRIEKQMQEIKKILTGEDQENESTAGNP